MNSKDKIKFLDDLIVHLKAARSVSMIGRPNAERDARKMQGAILEELKKNDCDEEIIEAINCVDFSGLNHREESISMSNMIGGSYTCTPQGEQSYYHSMQNMIDILTDYRDALKEEMEKPMKLWTLIFSAIAAVGAILSFIF